MQRVAQLAGELPGPTALHRLVHGVVDAALRRDPQLAVRVRDRDRVRVS